MSTAQPSMASAVPHDEEAAEPIEFACGALTFEQWLAAIEDEVVRITGLGREDFTDWQYADAFEEGVEPVVAARDMLAADVLGAQFLELAGIEGGF